MTLLETIVANKKREVLLKKQLASAKQLEHYSLFERHCVSMKKALQKSQTGIIAEHKRRSPSKAVINQSVSLEEIVSAYDKAGAAAISILTDAKYFGGSLEDLWIARSVTSLPLLRKDFIVDEYQVLEAKAFGADVILLIAASLSLSEIKKLSGLAKQIGLEVLLEVHNKLELETSITDEIDIIGVNNRNLKTLEISLEVSKYLSNAIPESFVKIAESGIDNAGSLLELKKMGYQGFLIGEYFMKAPNPGEALSSFIQKTT